MKFPEGKIHNLHRIIVVQQNEHNLLTILLYYNCIIIIVSYLARTMRPTVRMSRPTMPATVARMTTEIPSTRDTLHGAEYVGHPKIDIQYNAR